MLVKLGNAWVDPIKVVNINPDGGVMTTEGMMPIEGNPDDFASIINSSLQTQTFGGGEDEAAKEKSPI